MRRPSAAPSPRLFASLGLALLGAASALAAEARPLLAIVDATGSVVNLSIEFRPDHTLVRHRFAAGEADGEARLSDLEFYRLSKFLASDRMSEALAELGKMPGPDFADGWDVAIYFRETTEGYAVTCAAPTGRARELLDLVNGLLAAHFGADARVTLRAPDCGRDEEPRGTATDRAHS